MATSAATQSAAAGSSALPGTPKSSQLPAQPTVQSERGAATLTEKEKAALLADAGKCVEMMRGQLDIDGKVILDARAAHSTLEHVAAALALRAGRFRFKSGKLNPSAAAKAFGKPTSRPGAITQWLAKLERLDEKLIHDQPTAEEGAELARAKVVRACTERAVQRVLQQARMDYDALKTRSVSALRYLRPRQAGASLKTVRKQKHEAKRASRTERLAAGVAGGRKEHAQLGRRVGTAPLRSGPCMLCGLCVVGYVCRTCDLLADHAGARNETLCAPT